MGLAQWVGGSSVRPLFPALLLPPQVRLWWLMLPTLRQQKEGLQVLSRATPTKSMLSLLLAIPDVVFQNRRPIITGRQFMDGHSKSHVVFHLVAPELSPLQQVEHHSHVGRAPLGLCQVGRRLVIGLNREGTIRRLDPAQCLPSPPRQSLLDAVRQKSLACRAFLELA